MNKNAVIKAVNSHKRFLISTHVNPDADAIGSALAMAVALKSMGKTVVVLNEDAVPEWLSFLPKTEWFKMSKDVRDVVYDAAIVLDCGDLSRVGSVRGLLRTGKPVINIDHHKTNDHFGDINLVVPKSSSTVEVLYGLFKDMKIGLSKDLAVLLYAGLMTDTGSFRYDCTSMLSHQMAGELIGLGVKPQDIYTQIYDVVSIKDLKQFMSVSTQVEFLSGGRVACLELRQTDLKKFSDSFDVRDKMFGLLRSAKEVGVIVIFNEVGKTRTRVNFRSKGSVDVSLLAARFQGGGHAKASGCTLDLSLKETRKVILPLIIKELG
ncbi:MAG: bifunctional oligoribonuclease/PAP phosphatase NrnA [Candidatus Omnitrophica bacterium]|nr:bifunctional oligoribonuclease/PAP phosphatase NrnA [Candidatus Omnitrophota bacterium]